MLRSALLLAALGCASQLHAAAKPNVVLVITDDQGYGDLSCHGNPVLKTPNLDRLAAESVRFDRFYVSPVCAPTRASLLTGRYALRTGVFGTGAGEETMRPGEKTIADAFKAGGYRTGLFGKWHNGENYPLDPRGRGFDEFFGYTVGHWNNYFDTTLKHNGRPAKANGYVVDALTDEAIKFIAAGGDGPFLCYLSLTTPHAPFQVPDLFFDRYKALGLDNTTASVYGMCANIDDNVGRVLKLLDDKHLREDTVVLFLTDNGANTDRFNAGMRGRKGSLHEGGSRVPLFVRYPARLKQPRTVPEIAAHIDILPTLCELCGVPVPTAHPIDGKSLVPLLDGKAGGWPDRTLYTQHRLLPKWAPARGAVRTQTHRLVAVGKEWHLFDMAADPGETTNIAAKQPALAKELAAGFEKWYAEVRTGAEGPRPANPVGYEQENPAELLAPLSAFSGGAKFNGVHPNNAWLVGWGKPGAEVAWDIDAATAGEYEVTLRYVSPGKDTPVEVTAAGQTRAATLPAAAGRQFPSPDRVPRTEVYELDWPTAPAGVLTLPKGQTRLVVRPAAGADGFGLKSVLLRKR